MSSRLDWDIVRGDTSELAFAVTWANGSTDITGAQVRLTARLNGARLVYLANVAAGGLASEIAITDALDGELSVYFVAATTAAVEFLSADTVVLDYDLELVRPDGTRETAAHGSLRVQRDQTR